MFQTVGNLEVAKFVCKIFMSECSAAKEKS